MFCTASVTFGFENQDTVVELIKLVIEGAAGSMLERFTFESIVSEVGSVSSSKFDDEEVGCIGVGSRLRKARTGESTLVTGVVVVTAVVDGCLVEVVLGYGVVEEILCVVVVVAAVVGVVVVVVVLDVVVGGEKVVVVVGVVVVVVGVGVVVVGVVVVVVGRVVVATVVVVVTIAAKKNCSFNKIQLNELILN